MIDEHFEDLTCRLLDAKAEACSRIATEDLRQADRLDHVAGADLAVVGLVGEGERQQTCKVNGAPSTFEQTLLLSVGLVDASEASSHYELGAEEARLTMSASRPAATHLQRGVLASRALAVVVVRNDDPRLRLVNHQPCLRPT